MSLKLIGQQFEKDQSVYIFEYGEGKFIKRIRYDEQEQDEILLIQFGKISNEFKSSNCFFVNNDGPNFRRWKLNKYEIEITEDPIQLHYLGQPVWVKYSEQEGDEELFETDDALHKDWDGMGIDFQMIIKKWLQRLNGELIPLSGYYQDPFNRWLDNLKD